MQKFGLSLLWLFGLLLIVMSSCKKDPIQYTFEGHISESVNNWGLSGVAVSIFQRKVLNGTTSANFSAAGSTNTDGGGNYKIVFDREKVTEFLVTLEKDNYFPQEINKSSGSISTENPNVVNSVMDPKSWIKFELINDAPSPDDEFRLITKTFREGCEDCIGNTTTTFSGAIDTTFTWITTGGVYAKFIFIDVDHEISGEDSVFATPFETVTKTIHY